MKITSNSSKMATIFVGNLLTLFVGIVSAPIITRLVDPNDYGQLSFFNIYTNIISIILSLCLDRAYLRFYYDLPDNQRLSLFFDCLKYSLSMFVFSLPIIIVIAHRLSIIVGSLVVLILFLVNLLIVIIQRFSFNLLRVQQKSFMFSLSNFSNKFFYSLLAILLIRITSINHFYILILSTIFSSVIAIVISLIANFSDEGKKQLERMPVEIKKNTIFTYSIPIVVQSVIAILFQSVDILMIKYYGNFSDVGVYSAAAYYIALFTVFNSSITTIIGPEMFKFNASNHNETHYYVKINRLMTFMLFFIGLSMVGAKDLLVLVMGQKYRQVGMIMPFLMFNPIMTNIAEINSIGIEIKRKTVYYILITSVSIITNVAGCYFLIPIFGSKGAAMSTGFSYIVSFSVATLVSSRILKFDFGLKKFASMTIIMFAFALYSTFYKSYSVITIGYIVSIGILIVLYFDQLKYFIQKGNILLHKLRK